MARCLTASAPAAAAVAAALFTVLSCGSADRTGRLNPLRLPADSPARSDAALLERIASTPHDYFRFVNTAFAREVCARFEPLLPALPIVNLHGDAHLEQFAARADSLGLVDFDDSASGPPVIDLVRFGVSVELARRQLGFQGRSDALFTELLYAYDLGLSEADEPPAPGVVTRLRASFGRQTEFLEWVDERMEPVSGPERAEAEASYARYVDLILKVNPTWSASRFELVRWGRLIDGGIGSATTSRYLLRIEGESSAPEDDVILEAKELRNLEGVPCITAQRGDALRIVASAARFGQRMDPFLAAVPRTADVGPDDRPWWVQSWTPRYAEVDIDETFHSVEELASVVRTAGFQMARGHTNLLPPPYDRQLRELVKAMLMERERDIRDAVLELTELTLAAHREIREESGKDEGTNLH